MVPIRQGRGKGRAGAYKIIRAIDAGKHVGIKRRMLRASLNPDSLHTVLFGK
jgi:hypothetical protein